MHKYKERRRRGSPTESCSGLYGAILTPFGSPPLLIPFLLSPFLVTYALSHEKNVFDLSEGEWTRLRGYLLIPKAEGRPRTHSPYAVLPAIAALSLLATPLP